MRRATAAGTGCDPCCVTCARLSAELADLRARVDAMSRALSQAFVVTGHTMPAAVGQNVPARPVLTLHQGGAA